MLINPVDQSPPFFGAGEIAEIDQSHTDWDFVYQQSTGQLALGYANVASSDLVVHHRIVICTGYAGRGEHINSPAAEHLVGQGPPPRGIYALESARTHRDLGPFAIPFRWIDYTNGKGIPGGRSGFYFHGDNARGDRTASSGCIIVPREIRQFIEWQRKLRPVSLQLHVIA